MPAEYSNDFESEPVGPLGNTGDLASGMQVAVASTLGFTAISGTKVLVSNNQGDGIIFGGTGTKVDQDIRAEFRANLSNVSAPFVLLRLEGRQDGLWYYYGIVQTNGTGLRINIHRCEGGTFLSKAASAYVTCSAGDVICVEMTCTGTNPVLLEGRIWRKADSRPSSPQVTYSDSDSTRITVGHVGLRAELGTMPQMLDNVVYGDGTGGLDTFGGGGPATAITLSGPSSGTVGVASTNFTVGANGTITGTITVTPSDGGDGGTFSPTTVAISAGTPTATFTYTAANAGSPTATITVTNNGGLTNPAGIAYTATAPAATSLVVTVPDAAGLSGFSAAVLSTSTPTAGSTVIRTATAITFNGSGVATIDITGLGVSVGARRWVTLSNSNGDPAQTPAPKQASGPVAAS